MSERWAIDMIEILRGKKYGATPSGELHEATITSVKPLTLSILGEPITRNIYIDPALIFEADGNVDRVEQVFSSVSEPSAATEFLKGFHKRFILRKGDTVMVLLNGSTVYVIQKVVAV